MLMLTTNVNDGEWGGKRCVQETQSFACLWHLVREGARWRLPLQEWVLSELIVELSLNKQLHFGHLFSKWTAL